MDGLLHQPWCLFLSIQFNRADGLVLCFWLSLSLSLCPCMRVWVSVMSSLTLSLFREVCRWSCFELLGLRSSVSFSLLFSVFTVVPRVCVVTRLHASLLFFFSLFLLLLVVPQSVPLLHAVLFLFVFLFFSRTGSLRQPQQTNQSRARRLPFPSFQEGKPNARSCKICWIHSRTLSSLDDFHRQQVQQQEEDILRHRLGVWETKKVAL